MVSSDICYIYGFFFFCPDKALRRKQEYIKFKYSVKKKQNCFQLFQWSNNDNLKRKRSIFIDLINMVDLYVIIGESVYMIEILKYLICALLYDLFVSIL
jgi:hypothetical protein